MSAPLIEHSAISRFARAATIYDVNITGPGWARATLTIGLSDGEIQIAVARRNLVEGKMRCA